MAGYKDYVQNGRRHLHAQRGEVRTDMGENMEIAAEKIPFFTIITPCFNSEKTIGKTIESVLSQTMDNFEYIIVDGASTDGTLSVIENYRPLFEEKKIALQVISEKDNGIYDAMNKGIFAARGKFVGIINSDDYYEPIALGTVKEEYEKMPFEICFANLRIFDEKGSFIKKAKLGKRFKKRYWNHPTMFVSREIYQKRVYRNETLFDDLDFMLWALKFGCKVKTIDKVLANFRLGGASSERSLKKSFARIKLANRIYKQNGFKGYGFENAAIEIIKYIKTR